MRAYNGCPERFDCLFIVQVLHVLFETYEVVVVEGRRILIFAQNSTFGVNSHQVSIVVYFESSFVEIALNGLRSKVEVGEEVLRLELVYQSDQFQNLLELELFHVQLVLLQLLENLESEPLVGLLVALQNFCHREQSARAHLVLVVRQLALRMEVESV